MNPDIGVWVDAPPAHLLKLALAFLLALPIACTRDRENHSAVLRTLTILAVASCSCVNATQSLLTNSAEGPVRIIQGLTMTRQESGRSMSPVRGMTLGGRSRRSIAAEQNASRFGKVHWNNHE